jgi:hypothetical protein
MPIPSHHSVGDTGHAADHNAIVDMITTHDQAISTLQSTTVGLFYVAGGNVSGISGTATTWARVNLPTGDRSAAVDTYQVYHGSNKIFWLDGYGRPRVKVDDPSHIPSIIDSPVGQTANLEEWRVNGVAKAYIDASGNLRGANTDWGPWTNITLQSGIVWYQHSTHVPQYRVKGDLVQLRGCVAKSNGTDFTSSPVTLATLPIGARPSALTYNAVARQANGNTLLARLEVNSAGTIVVYTNADASGAWISFDNTQFSTLPDS